LIIYDTDYGNTKMVAERIAGMLGKAARVVPVASIKAEDITDVDLIIFGSPILGWNASEKTRAFLTGLRPGQLKGVKAAAFDTRVPLFIHSDAAKKIAAALEVAGANIVVESKGFTVMGREGPLRQGKLEKAKAWAKEIAARL
jgi:flavodoxin